jgi:hypothetical protein
VLDKLKDPHPALPLARGGTFCFVALYKGKCLKDKGVSMRRNMPIFSFIQEED